MKKIFSFMLLLVSMSMMVACSDEDAGTASGKSESDDKQYEIRISTAFDRQNPQVWGLNHFEDLVEERLGDKVKINYVGGPESIPAFNQGEAIQNGTIDMSWTATSYYAELVPEALITNFTAHDYETEIEKGSIEYLSSLHEQKMNAKLVGRASQAIGNNYSIYTAKDVRVESMADFKGLKIRGTATYTPTLEALGADVISMPGDEIFSALDKGIIDGFAWASYSVLDLGVEKLVGTQILPKFNMSDIVILANNDFWNDLPDNIQTELTDIAIESYHLMREDIKEVEEKEQAKLKENGAEIVELTDGEEFVEMAREKSWEWMATKTENIEELKKYFDN